MQKNTALTLLGGLTPEQFMKRHWQKKPLLIRQALPDMKPLIERSQLLEMVESEEVESRLIVRKGAKWNLKKGPMGRKSLPSLKTPDWTVLIQGVDLHNDAVHSLLQQFRFVPDARLDDLMISFASEGGGVGPHFDSYDVFLLQAHGQRRWRIGRQKDLSLRPDLPLKVLAHFKPEQEFVLNPGDMLYLPPRYAHDGVALGECMTYSVGFRAPQLGELARELLVRGSESVDELLGDELYKDANQPAVQRPAGIPEGLREFAKTALERALKDPLSLERALGELLTEPKANVWFEASAVPRKLKRVRLDRRSRMMYDKHHIFLNGESWRASGADAVLMRRLADDRQLGVQDLAVASPAALGLLMDWCDDGWLHAMTEKDRG